MKSNNGYFSQPNLNKKDLYFVCDDDIWKASLDGGSALRLTNHQGICTAPRSQAHDIKLFFWRDPDGPEVDWVVQHENRLLPIKVKLKSNPKESDARHLVTFMNEYSQAKSAWVI